CFRVVSSFSWTNRITLNHTLRHSSQRFQRLLDPFRPEGGVEAKAVPVPVAHGENGTRGNADPLLQCRLVKLEGIEPFRHLHPQDISPLGAADPCPEREIAI